MTAVDDVLTDLRNEQGSLDALVADLGPAGWSAPTPAEGWDVRDQIWHLAYFDDVARLAAADPEAFAAHLREVASDLAAYEPRVVDAGRRQAPAEVLAAWRANRQTFADAVTALDPATRVPWYGVRMGVVSLVTARLMETWAHGQDVADGLQVEREPTDRLRHIAFLGCRAMPFSFRVRGEAPPPDPVHVALALPSGARFTYGPEEASDRVTGSALDFCLVVTQRRHLDDVPLEVSGAVANAWMPLAQAFAGPPGPGRQPGAHLAAGRRSGGDARA